MEKKVLFLPGYIVKPIYILNNFVKYQSSKFKVKLNEDFHNNHDISICSKNQKFAT